jgi:hypothetical protein
MGHQGAQPFCMVRLCFVIQSSRGGATAMRSSATHLDTRLLTRVAAQVVLMANTWYRNSDGIADYESGDAGFAF